MMLIRWFEVEDRMLVPVLIHTLKNRRAPHSSMLLYTCTHAYTYTYASWVLESNGILPILYFYIYSYSYIHLSLYLLGTRK